MKATNRFARGSGLYQCSSCGRSTRSTGRGDNENVGLCAECYDYAGVENEISDYGSTPALESKLARLRTEIAAKGGDVTGLGRCAEAA